MANIKITELNELTEIATDDVLPIVDVSADETKKIKLKSVLNVELVAITDTAPSECSIGDKYFNTTTSLIYTAVATDTWGTTGESPVEGVFYILFNEQSSYAWNGTTLVSVGGGKEDIVIDDEEPTDPDVKLWIDTGEIAQAHTEITNSYSTSTGLGYSANYANNNFATKDYVQNDTVSYLHIFKKGHFVMVMGYLRVNADNKTITLPYKSKYKIEVPTTGFYDISFNPQGYGYGKVEENSNSMVFKFNAAVTEAPLNFVYYTDDED